jgi:hypothetical protein
MTCLNVQLVNIDWYNSIEFDVLIDDILYVIFWCKYELK